LPGAILRACRITQRDLVEAAEPGYWPQHSGVAPEDVNAWLMFADPFHLDTEALLDSFSAAYPGTPIIGGLASSTANPHQTHLFLDGEVYDEGAVAISLGGAYTVKTVVSQGCDPIGEPWIITAANGSIVETISQRPAYEVLVDTVRALPPDVQERASRNLLVGLAMDEYKDSFSRGDFLIRGVMGADPKSGALAIGAHPRVGQTIQFQIRDAKAADEDLRQLLNEARDALGDTRPVGALLCSCNGRGEGLFGFPDHDARTVAQQLGAVPLAGFFCNGEIGPIGSRVFLHGFTASLALIVPKVSG
jgi:small ligand-binding sensory domain FIST